MEDIQTLLMMVLKHHFRERSQILDEALHVIKEYSSEDSIQTEYEKTLHILRDKMSDLPKNILLYFLSMVPLPKHCDVGYASPLVEEMKSSEYQTTESIRPKLVEYLNDRIPPLVLIKKHVHKGEANLEIDKDVDNAESTQAGKEFVPPRKIVQAKRRNTRNMPKDCKSLLDICAENVIKNQAMLSQFYKHKREKAWRLVNDTRYSKVKLYEVIKDINRKAKLLRMIDCDEVSFEVIHEEYGNSDVFLKEHNLYDDVYEDPFELSAELNDAVVNFVCN